MKFDWYVKTVLTIIAIALLLLVFKGNSPFMRAEASEGGRGAESKLVLDVQAVKTIPVTKLVNVISLDNQRTFIIIQKDNVTVYRIDYVEK